MARTEILTAYKCKFSYLQRNNPLIEKHRKAIKAGESPDFSFSDFMKVYSDYAKHMKVGKNTDRAILLDADKLEMRLMGDTKVWHLVPSSGKQGKPVKVVKTTGEKYDFNSDTAALYEHQVFVYENSDIIIAIFHRQSGSGCKSVFLETANNSIRNLGIKLEMEVVVPMSDKVNDVVPTRITLQYTKKKLSSDVADNINGPKSKRIVRELCVNLEEKDNFGFKDIISKFYCSELSQEVAFGLLKKEANDSVEYDDAEVVVRTGKGYRTAKWCDIENILGTHDITDRLHDAFKKSKDFVGELIKLSDEYYSDIIKTGEI